MIKYFNIKYINYKYYYNVFSLKRNQIYYIAQRNEKITIFVAPNIIKNLWNTLKKYNISTILSQD